MVMTVQPAYQVEQYAQQNPPPPPPEESEFFPTKTAVAALVMWWLLRMGRQFNCMDEMRDNVLATIERVSDSRILQKTHNDFRRALTSTNKKSAVAEAWDIYYRNIKNTAEGTAVTAIAMSVFNTLSPDQLIQWLPTLSHEPDIIHTEHYFQWFRVEDAIERGLCIRPGCKCGFTVG